jgi:hypothetical protein
VQTKKARERDVFDSVYAIRAPALVVPSERPDFIVRQTQQSSEFGVEVAEFFDSEVEARLRRLPGYVSHLLDGGVFKHKKDRHELTVDKVSLTDADGNVTHADIPAIIRRVPPLASCSEMVAEIVRLKSAKLNPGSGAINHMNLIIADRTHLLGSLDAASFYRVYCGSALRQAVLGTNFREVYFITSFKSGPVFIPLKLLIVLAGLYVFQSVVAQRHDHEIDTAADLMRLFARYLHAVAIGAVGVRPEGHLVEVLYGDSGFIVDEDLAVTIRMYNDRPWPADVSRQIEDVTLADGLVQAIGAFEAENTFATEIAFPVASTGFDAHH